MESLKKVITALEVLEDVQACISVSVPICDEVKEFIQNIKKDFLATYVLDPSDDRFLILTIEKKNVQQRLRERINSFYS